MNARLCILLTLLATLGISIECHALTGKWRGDLNMGVAKLPLVFNFNEGADGKTMATMDSPQQNAKGIALEVTVCTDDSVRLECKMLGATYAGKIGTGKIEGVFSQRGYKFPLTLTPEVDLSERRPQTPKPPFPYTNKDTVFTSTDGTQLAGTLTIPDHYAEKKMPVVVMVTGSGPQNRDEEIFEHRPFAVVADYLAKNGIASLRYDDRGVASSKGVYTQATTETFKEDAASALKFAKSFPEFDRAGILGHSEGGTLAIMIAAEDQPDFIISLAGVSVPIKEVMLEQNARLFDRSGISGQQKESSMKLLRKVFDSISEQYRSGMSSTTEPDIDAICREESLDVPSAVIESIKRNLQTRNGYFNSLVSLDPTEDLKKIKCRGLAINGTKDTQVNADINLEAFRRNVKSAEIKRMEGLNHLMQHAKTGETAEYGEIRETISPEVLDILVDFINQK